MGQFNFANLIGGRARARAENDDQDPTAENEDPATMEDDDVAAEGDPEAEPDAEDDVETDPTAEDEDKMTPEAKRAWRRGLAAGRKAERARCGKIMAAAGAGQAAQAAHLAFNTDLPPGQAKGVLALGGTGGDGGGLSARMRGASPAPLAAGGGAGGGDKDADRAARVLAMRKRG